MDSAPKIEGNCYRTEEEKEERERGEEVRKTTHIHFSEKSE